MSDPLSQEMLLTTVLSQRDITCRCRTKDPKIVTMTEDEQEDQNVLVCDQILKPHLL
jgi:hypothetical protein